MPYQLYFHPLSSYCQKALVALYENAVSFQPYLLDGPGPASRELEKLWPMKRFPVLVDGDRTIIEASCIIEYVGLRTPGSVQLIPDDPSIALEVRMMDRFFDNYVSTPQQKIVADALRPPDQRDPYGVQLARDMLDTSYAWLDKIMQHREWAAGPHFSLADCAAAPFLFYADWTHAIGNAHPNVTAYRNRLMMRPSFARAIDEARPYRYLFPLGAPDRD